MKLLKIKPCDNTFFGTGQPFNFDNNSFIESMVFPYPSVFFGAIFTAMLTENNDFRKIFFKNKRNDHEKILNIGKIYIYDESKDKTYLRAPKDIFINSKGERDIGKFEKISENEKVSLSFPYYLKAPTDKDYKRIKGQFININNLYDSYEKKQKRRIELKDEKDIFNKYSNIGITVDYTSKLAKEGKIYRRQQSEFTDNSLCFIVEYEIRSEYLKINYPGVVVRDLDRGYLKLGGENRAAKYEITTNKDINEFKRKKCNSVGNKIKLMFTSATFFKEGIKEVFNSKFKILGISNDKPIYIGGIDLNNENNKKSIRKMYKGYPEGTILFIEYIGSGKLRDELDEIMKQDAKKGFNEYIYWEENNG